MVNADLEARVGDRYRAMDRPRPDLRWSKIEILLGLAAMRIAFAFASESVVEVAASIALFALGGYLALAGHRSHLYDAMTRTASADQEAERRRDEGGAR